MTKTADEAETPATPVTASPRLLVVEDNAVVGEILSQQLEAMGRPCDWAANAEAALSRMAVHPYAGLVIDQYMPGLDGLGLVRRMREQAAWAAVPAVLVTSASGPDLDGIRRELAGLRPAALVQKPCGVADVAAALDGLAAGGGSGRWSRCGDLPGGEGGQP